MSTKRSMSARTRTEAYWTRDRDGSGSACFKCPKRGGRRGSGARGPLGLGEVALGHVLGRVDARRVAQVPLRVERGLGARAGGRDRQAVRVVDEVARREDAGELG